MATCAQELQHLGWRLVDPRTSLASQPIQNGELLAQAETLSQGTEVEDDGGDI